MGVGGKGPLKKIRYSCIQYPLCREWEKKQFVLCVCAYLHLLNKAIFFLFSLAHEKRNCIYIKASEAYIIY